jgi:hypothetical protein
MARIAAFIAGMGTGYMNQSERERDRERQDKRDQMEKERFDAAMEEVNRAKQERIRMAEATKPAVVNETASTLDMGDGAKVYESQDVASSDYRQARRMGADNVQAPQQTLAVNGIAFPDRGAAAAYTEQYNSDEATDRRASAAQLSLGNYEKARAIRSAATADSRGTVRWNHEQLAIAKKMKEEGAEETAKAMLTGDPATVFQTFNANGEVKLKAPPTVTQSDLDLPGFGKVKNYTYSGVLVNEDGSETPFTRDSHSANMAIFKYKEALELQGKGAERADTAAYRKDVTTEQKRHNQAQEGIAGASLAESRETHKQQREVFKRQSLEGQVGALETAIGRPLSKSERENTVKKLAGLGTDEASVDKFASTLVQEAVKAGTMTAEDAPAARGRIMAQIGAAQAQERIRTGLSQARTDGKMAEAVRDLRAKGLTDAQIVALGGDVGAAKPKTAIAQEVDAAAPGSWRRQPQAASGVLNVPRQ